MSCLRETPVYSAWIEQYREENGVEVIEKRFCSLQCAGTHYTSVVGTNELEEAPVSSQLLLGLFCTLGSLLMHEEPPQRIRRRRRRPHRHIRRRNARNALG